jgi:hypothetical protein
MLIVVNGIFGSGSTCIYNLARALLRRTVSEYATFGVVGIERANRLIKKFPVNKWGVLKVHGWTPAGEENTYPIYAHRDIRDALASHMRRAKTSFESELRLFQREAGISRQIKKDKSAMIVPYKRIVGDLKGVASDIGKYVGLPIDQETAASIAKDCSIPKMKELLRRGDVKDALLKPAHISKSNGASNYSNVLTAGQIDKINELFGSWLREFGYE